MTTIAWDGITIAGDGRSCSGEWIASDDCVKLFRRGDKVIGVCGAWADVPAMLEYICDGEWDEDASNVSALVVVDKFARLYEGSRRPFRIKAPYAIGSGATAAMAAMYAGADAHLAVKIAAKLDPGTGGKVSKIRCTE